MSIQTSDEVAQKMSELRKANPAEWDGRDLDLYSAASDLVHPRQPKKEEGQE